MNEERITHSQTEDDATNRLRNKEAVRRAIESAEKEAKELADFKESVLVATTSFTVSFLILSSIIKRVVDQWKR